MITGRVQIEESTKPKKIEVGSAFARNHDGNWKSLEGKPLKKIEIKNLKEKVQQKSKKN